MPVSDLCSTAPVRFKSRSLINILEGLCISRTKHVLLTDTMFIPGAAASFCWQRKCLIHFSSRYHRASLPGEIPAYIQYRHLEILFEFFPFHHLFESFKRAISFERDSATLASRSKPSTNCLRSIFWLPNMLKR
jgi:hypothetical protein